MRGERTLLIMRPLRAGLTLGGRLSRPTAAARIYRAARQGCSSHH
jgi:hypothetical protein